MALDLLDDGTSAAAIRLIDIRAPVREEFANGKASQVSFVQADITSETSTTAAFETPWPASVASLPLTVFHTAAVIRPYERHEVFYARSSRVNVVGTANSLSAARRAGASVFIYTSSAHVAGSPVGWFFPLWWRQPRNFAQVLTEEDFFKPLRQASGFPSNYARSKAEAERLVCGADSDSFRTGCIRPGSGVYGDKDDLIIGRMLRLGRVPTFSATWVQNWAHVRNVSAGHVLLERQLLGDNADKVRARPFVVTDGEAIRFEDMYTVLDEVSVSGLRVDYPPPVLLLLLSYVVEAYCVLLERVPALKGFGLRELRDPVCLFQPAIVDSTVTQVVDDGDARRWLGYESACGTVEGLCVLVGEWNGWVERGVSKV